MNDFYIFVYFALLPYRFDFDFMVLFPCGSKRFTAKHVMCLENGRTGRLLYLEGVATWIKQKLQPNSKVYSNFQNNIYCVDSSSHYHTTGSKETAFVAVWLKQRKYPSTDIWYAEPPLASIQYYQCIVGDMNIGYTGEKIEWANDASCWMLWSVQIDFYSLHEHT